MTPINEINILLVEDNLGDIELTRQALLEVKMHNKLDVARDGVEAMEFLRREGAAYRPDLILLDINMPRKNGLELLAEIKGDPQLRRIPVVILTTSDSDRDVVKAYDLNANSYITKPVDLDQFMKVIHSIDDFWLSIVKLPPR